MELLNRFMLVFVFFILVGCGGGGDDSQQNVCGASNVQFELKPVSDFTDNFDCVLYDALKNTGQNYWDCSSGSVDVDRVSVSGGTVSDISFSLGDLGINRFELTFQSDDTVNGTRGTMSLHQSTRECGDESDEINYSFDGCNAVEFIDGHGYVIGNLDEGSMNVVYGVDSLSGYVDGDRVDMQNVIFTHNCRLRN